MIVSKFNNSKVDKKDDEKDDEKGTLEQTNPILYEALLKFDLLLTDRTDLEVTWNELASYLLPEMSGLFGQGHRDKGKGITDTNIEQVIFDSTPETSVRNFGNILDSLLTPLGKPWHSLTTGDIKLDELDNVREWLENTSKTLFTERYKDTANFPSQNASRWLELAVFGSSAMYIDYENGLRYRSIPLSAVYFDTNHQGIVDTVYRIITLSLNQVVEVYGLENLSMVLQDKYTQIGKREESIELLHIVSPNRVIDNNAISGISKKFLVHTIEKETNHEVTSLTGLDEMPYSIARYSVIGNNIYGRGQSFTALSDIKSLNLISRERLVALHKASSPAYLASESVDGKVEVDLTPNSINVGYLSPEGKQLIVPMITGADTRAMEQLRLEYKESIKELFLNNLFQILVQSPNMTATEALIRSQEKGVLLNPAMLRQQSETLGTQITREIVLLIKAGKIRPLPIEITGGGVDISYTSPLNKSIERGEIVAIEGAIDSLMKYASIDPAVFDSIDIDAVVRRYFDVGGVPLSVLRTVEEVNKIRKNRDTQSQTSQADTSAVEQSQASLSLANANKINKETELL